MSKLLLATACCCFVMNIFSQSNSIGIGTTTPSDKSILDIVSTTKGISIPRLTTAQRNGISGLVAANKGLMIYNTDVNRLQHFDGVAWMDVSQGDNLGTHQATTNLNMSGWNINNANDVYSNTYFINTLATRGLYNLETGSEFFSANPNYWHMFSNEGMIFRNNAGATRGLLAHDATNFGFKNELGYWTFRVGNTNSEIFTPFYTNLFHVGVMYDRNDPSYFIEMDNSANLRIVNTLETRVQNSFYVNGSGGIFWQAHGGGWQMTDATWLRTWNNRPILAGGGIAGYGNNLFGSPFGLNPRMYANYDNAVGGGIMVSDDGGFADFNDGWIQSRGSNGLWLQSNNAATILHNSMTHITGVQPFDKVISTSHHQYGMIGAPGASWYHMHAAAYNIGSERHIKKDITKVTGALHEQVMNDLDKLSPYLYRYKVESDQMVPGQEAKFRPGLHMGLIVDEAPDYIQSASFDGIDIYAAATLGIAAAKHNREEIKEIKQSLGISGNTIIIQDIGSLRTQGKQLHVTFDPSFIESLKGITPVVTISTNSKGADLTVQNKSSKGFTVNVNGDASDVEFDYIAMAKVKPDVHVEKSSFEIPARMYVDESVKSQVRSYWKNHQQKLKAEEDKTRREAVGIQHQRKNEIEIKEER